MADRSPGDVYIVRIDGCDYDIFTMEQDALKRLLLVIKAERNQLKSDVDWYSSWQYSAQAKQQRFYARLEAKQRELAQDEQAVRTEIKLRKDQRAKQIEASFVDVARRVLDSSTFAQILAEARRVVEA